jgi:hypothetical protein
LVQEPRLNLARILAKNGIAATIANSRGPESLADFVAEVGPSIKAGTVAEAASADIVIAAVRWVDAERYSVPCLHGMVASSLTAPTQLNSSTQIHLMPKTPAIRWQPTVSGLLI